MLILHIVTRDQLVTFRFGSLALGGPYYVLHTTHLL